MKRLSLYFLCLIVLLSSLSCDKEAIELTLNIANLELEEDTSQVLRKTILFSITQMTDAYISYWESDKGENSARVTEVSESALIHKINVFALKENLEYNFRINLENGASYYESEVFSFRTGTIPDWVKHFYEPAENKIITQESGYFMFHKIAAPSCLIITNHLGEIVWYKTSRHNIKVARFTKHGTLLTLEDDQNNPFASGNIILETTLAGDTLLYLRYGQGDFSKIAHHDVQLTQHNDIMFLTDEHENGLPGDGILVLDRSGQKKWEWSSFDVFKEIDAKKYVQPWSNSIFQDEDGHYLVSFRKLSQVWKIHNVSGNVIWKLGQGGDFQLSQEAQFQYQHYAHINDKGHLMLFDNGSTDRPQSRILILSPDQPRREARLIHSVDLPADLFSPIMGSAALLPDNDFLCVSSTQGTILKLDRSGAVKWKMKANDRVYRVEYIDQLFK
ncbi:arylsulfotransferase family protein [Fulvivirgaceae bacterium BMA10]|uniref:Arylsulfotransferase family protein n=1 Tax=Splendidivirga corallicola TaxID=3051826 RepID=A0ABT8KJ26_9BACT|nr:arylsulfotransferase family protein [Fulvivirgaceae bacterium BMA10]